ncbi:SAM-dependent methyltransferase [Hydrogenophaga sp.]|uniref:class I SAM-dependent methyltransferase n=1 Tax=Hydrogenophaga sp. TaxID=1904254 RepID=UPI002729075C|nr:SAM-dependent methyltransferase [Hydrogenophaga sp.]MDO9436406.1 SAM-dependent methyltransferase [Hydrogenophaga sp.]
MPKQKDRARPAAPTLQHQLPELRPGQSIALLQELHILTREGKLNQDTRRKLKQVYHLVQFIEPLLAEVLAARGDVTLADHGAGKSYLGFILYDLFFKDKPVGRVTGVETRAELVDKSKILAAQLGFARMDFLATTVQQALTDPALPATIDVVTALHACDTATDDAIQFGLAKQASHMVLVPCCQAEVASVMKQHKALSLSRTPLAELWRHPLHTREFGSQITNVLRCLQLEAHGYSVTVTELVGWEHSMKNELILARRMAHDRSGARERARQRLQQVLDELQLRDLAQRFAV